MRCNKNTIVRINTLDSGQISRQNLLDDNNKRNTADYKINL